VIGTASAAVTTAKPAEVKARPEAVAEKRRRTRPADDDLGDRDDELVSPRHAYVVSGWLLARRAEAPARERPHYRACLDAGGIGSVMIAAVDGLLLFIVC